MRKTALVVLVFLGVNVLFNWQFWKELFVRPVDTNLYTMDGRITEWIVETGYQRVARGENPFTSTTKLFYPFETGVSLNDPGMLLLIPYSLFRPWLGIHQAMMGAVLLSLLASSIAMYQLLRALGHRNGVAVLLALVYTYMPFVGQEVRGHYTYLCLYLFPWLYLLMYEDNWVGAGVLAGLVWYGNFYYGISVVMAGLVYLVYGFKANYRKVILFFVSMLVTLSPWLLEVKYELLNLHHTHVIGYGGAVQLSADLLGLVSLRTWGVVLMLLLGYGLIKRKNLGVPLIATAWLAILSLGPFLKIFGRWHINLEGVEVFFPLPFLLLRSIPGLQGLRAPERFFPAMIFLACLAVAPLLKKTNKWIILGLGMIFLASQSYMIPYKEAGKIPTQLYETIAQSKGGTVLEIPFALRDGYQYRGFIYGLNPIYGQLIHHRSVVGGYLARVDEQVFNYYDGLSWVGHILKITDQGNYNRFTQLPRAPVVTEYRGTIETIKSELDMLNITDIIVKQDEPYTQQIERQLNDIGAKEMQQDQGYKLWRREL